MNSFALFLLMGGASGGEAPAPGSFITSLIPFVAIIAIFYFLIIRPQNKKQKDTQRMLEALKKGDKVVTIGGVHGTIQSVRDHSVIVKVDDNVKLEFSRSAISTVESQAKEEKAEKDDKKTESGSDSPADAGSSGNDKS
jgi:preprotein translocase subunit YajC